LIRLKDILKTTEHQLISGDADMQINQIQFDSRKIKTGDVFVAIKGTQVDGHDFIDTAIKLGACAIVFEETPAEMISNVCYIKSKQAAKSLALMAAEFYGNPTQSFKLIGVTGTNGKTTVVSLLYKLFKDLGYKCGLLSTIRVMIDDEEIHATHTTPDSLQLNQLFRQMADQDCSYCFMEVSSHAIDQFRIEGLQFNGALFTNITHDHLDYHKTFDNYIKTKKRFFDELPKDAFAVINKDDKNGQIMVQNTVAKVTYYAIKSQATVKTRIIECDLSGLHLQLDQKDFYTNKVGRFNAYNLTAVYSTAQLLGIDDESILKALSMPHAVDGRFELIYKHPAFKAIVDYAHTPDALENVIETINDLKKKNERLITVFGCGGNRDKSKRPVMGRIASTKSDLVFITSDNPRNEEPMAIIQEIEQGVPEKLASKCISISDRENAIKTACLMANPNDIILVAGKGHETYQEINGAKNHFDDKEILIKYLKEL
jgi:UDP-N-acetylmuramoyl-L-alanyl-D-glutamate--2,6-diaminopimelate ligase